MDWTDVERKLCERVEEVCRHLLPNGKRNGAEYQVGSLGGEAGDSLRINLSGKVGMWRDFAGDKGGKTLMSLWCSVRSKPFRECIVEAKGLLGIRDDYERRVKSYAAAEGGAGRSARPGETDESSWKGVAEVWAKCEALTDGGPVWEYLVRQRRIEPQVLDLYGVREMVSFGEWVMVFPYWAPASEEDGQILSMFAERTEGTTRSARPVRVPTWLKFEKLKRNEKGKKVEWTSKGPEKCLWGTQLSEVPAFRDCRQVLICEGEKDALSWMSYGCSGWKVLPVSVPFGAKWKGQVKGTPSPNREWLDRCWDWLQGFEVVFVAMDSDEEGRKAAADIITEIGPRRCRLVELPVRGGNHGIHGEHGMEVGK